jgi:uncharacterized lipoprotein
MPSLAQITEAIDDYRAKFDNNSSGLDVGSQSNNPQIRRFIPSNIA